jgi:multidrug efflux pump subunit AcrA (membrane-fusion protein)
VAIAGGGEPAKPVAAPAADGKPAETATAEQGPFEAVVELKGAFEPVDAVLVDHRPETFAQPLEIVKLASHGARVAEGEVILALDADRIDRAIADLEIDLAAGEKALEMARREVATAEATTPLELADAERQDRIATEDLARFTAVGRSLAEEEARFGVKAAEQRLRSAKEEFAQLEKMYKDKDLTEETEEMILQRTRFDVAAAEQFLRQATVASEDALTLDLPRRAVELERSVKKAALGLEKARATLPLHLEQKRLNVTKLEHDRRQAQRKLEELRHDRGLATRTAPRAGILYYGRLQDGAWTTAAVASKAIVGQAVPLGDLAFTIVGAGPLRFRARVDEKDLHLIAPGLAGRVTPAGYPDAPAAAALEPGFAPVPKDGKYDAMFTVKLQDGGPALAAGMTGTARFVVRSRADAITLPEPAVFRDGDGTRIVYIDREGATPEKRKVKTGLSSGGRIEILEGLAAGDRVRTTKP